MSDDNEPIKGIKDISLNYSLHEGHTSNTFITTWLDERQQSNSHIQLVQSSSDYESRGVSTPISGSLQLHVTGNDTGQLEESTQPVYWSKDYSELFTTKKIFPSRDKVVEWVYESVRGSWKVKVKEGHHNHEIGKSLHGHAFAGRFTEDQYDLVKTLSEDHVKPKNILKTLKRDPKNVTKLKQVYNAREKLRKEGMQGRTVPQQFFTKALQLKYFVRHRTRAGSDVLSEIVRAHPESIALLKAFPYVLVMDATYKVNRYDMPFFEVVGFTSTWKNFNVASAFMAGEKVGNYRWVVGVIAELCQLVGKTPTAIATDRELALITAITDIFPNIKHILCRRHVNKNLEDRAKKETGDVHLATRFANACMSLLWSQTEESYVNNLARLEVSWRHLPNSVAYLKRQWLKDYKTNLVSAWTNKVMYLGTRNTNRVEGAHSTFKQFMKPKGSPSLDSVFGNMHSVIEIQISEIKASFGQSRLKVMSSPASTNVFQLLSRVVSHKAIELMMKECKFAETSGSAEEICTCSILVTFGLPCYHKIARYKKQGVANLLVDVHPFWRQLDITVDEDAARIEDDGSSNGKRKVARSLMDAFYHKEFPRACVDDQYRWATALYDMRNPHQSSLKEPPVMQAKGRPKGSLNKRDLCGWEHTDLLLQNDSTPQKRGRGRTPLDRKSDGTRTTQTNKCGDSSEGTPPKRARGRPSLTRKSPITATCHQSPRMLATTTPSRTTPDSPPLFENENMPNWMSSLMGPSPPIELVEGPHIGLIPEWMNKFVFESVNVRPDGNCGYRAIAESYGDGQENWKEVQQKLYNELNSHPTLYAPTIVMRSFNSISKGLRWSGEGFAPAWSWLETSDMGLLVAMTFRAIFVVMGPSVSVTYLPLYLPDGYAFNHLTHITVCLDKESSHFTSLVLTYNAPLPHIPHLWFIYRDKSVEGLVEYLKERCDAYEALRPRVPSSPLVISD